MRISNAVLIAAIFCLPWAVCSAQSPTPGAPGSASPAEPTSAPPSSTAPVAPATPAPAVSSPPAAVAPAAPPTPSGLLQPSLDTLWQTVTALKLERWKRGTVRDETSDNVAEILRDIHTNLPPLLSGADSAPETISKELPVSRNIDALYDVLLRVYEAARVSAPPEQIAQIQQALVSLKNARVALDDRMQGSAAAIEKQMSDLQTKVDAQAAVKCPVAPPPTTPACVAPAPAKKTVKKKPNPPPKTTPASPATGAAQPQN
jgi:hypothetical protein